MLHCQRRCKIVNFQYVVLCCILYSYTHTFISGHRSLFCPEYTSCLQPRKAAYLFLHFIWLPPKHYKIYNTHNLHTVMNESRNDVHFIWLWKYLSNTKNLKYGKSSRKKNLYVRHTVLCFNISKMHPFRCTWKFPFNLQTNWTLWTFIFICSLLV